MKKIFNQLKNMEKWQKNRLLACFLLICIIGTSFLTYTIVGLSNDRAAEDEYWKNAMAETGNMPEKYAGMTKSATKVTTGMYVENLKSIDLKTNSFRVEMVVWFRWSGNNDLNMIENFRVYKGSPNKIEVIKEYHQGNDNYQLVRVDATISKNFWTKRFPLDSHQLRIYLESEYTADKVVLVPDSENSGMSRSLSISGYDLRRYDVGSYMNTYPNTQNDPTVTAPITTSEMMMQMEINRADMGLYMKCFVALLGTTIWVLITLFINTYHRVDPLGMVPAALFGTVTNIMVGANLLPDALQMGLLEYVNIWGILTILSVTFAIININRIRNKYEDRDFAALFGKIMFTTILIFVLIGHIALPFAAYLF